MSTDSQDIQTPETKQADKENNFRMLEAKYERQLAAEREARLEAEKKAAELEARRNQHQEEDDDDDSDPYVDHKRLNKKLAKFGQQNEQRTQQEIKKTAQSIREEIKRELWIENNPDFYDTLQNHANKLMEKAPHLAKSILSMPESFERQQLVYHNIKELGLDKPPQKTSSIQDTIDQKQRTPYYHPSGMGMAPYQSQSDFSSTGQKAAYEKMQELKNRLSF